MPNEHEFRYKSYVVTLAAFFVAALFGLAATALYGPTIGLTTAISLLLAIIWISNKVFSTLPPGLRVALAAISALSMGFMALAAVPSLQDRLISLAARILTDHNITLAIAPDSTDPSSYLLIIAIAISGIALTYIITNPDKVTQAPPSPAPTPDSSPKDAHSPCDDSVQLGLPSRSSFIAGTTASLLAPICLSELYRHQSLLSGHSSEGSIIETIQVGLAGLCLYSGIHIWLARRATAHSARERMTFWAPTLLIASAGIFTLTLASSIPPLSGALKFNAPSIRIQLLELLLWVAAPVGYFFRSFKKWQGRRSVEHHLAAEGKTEFEFLVECSRAWQWMWANRKLVRVYSPLKFIPTAPLEAPVAPVGWPQRGLDLVRLKKQELDFYQATHFQHATCWLPKHRVTGARVAVFVAPAGAADSARAHLESHITDILRSPGPAIERIIVITDSFTSTGKGEIEGHEVEWLSESELIATLVDFRSYAKDIREKVETMPIANSNRTIRQIHVKSSILLPDGDFADDVEEYLDNWLLEPGRRHVALLGDFGMGKSTAALMWTYRWLVERGFDGEHLPADFRVPIIIELRGQSPRNIAPEALLAAWAMRYHIDANAVHHLAANGRLVLIFEGFDETAFQGNEEARIAHFRTLWKLAYPHSKLLFTGRPNFFANPTERESALRLGKPFGDSPYCTAVTLCGLSIDQISSALRDQREEIRNQIVERARSHERFRDLVSRPTLLHALTAMWEKDRFNELSDDRLTSARVVGAFVRHSDLREGLKELNSSTYQPVLTREERAYFMSGIACHMLVSRLPNQITGEELEVLVERLYVDIPEIVSRPLPGLRQRIGTASELRYGMLTDIRTTGLLVEDGARTGAFRFAHKSYMEYLAGEQVAMSLVEPFKPSVGALRFISGINPGNLRGHPEVTLFCAEVLIDTLHKPGRVEQEIEFAQRLLSVLEGGRALSVLRRWYYRHWTRLGIDNQRILDQPDLLQGSSSRLTKRMLNFVAESGIVLVAGIFWFAPTNENNAGVPFQVISGILVTLLIGFKLAPLAKDLEPSPRYIVWLISCLRANVSRRNIAASVKLGGGIDPELPLLPVDTVSIDVLIRQLMVPLGLVLGAFGWRRFILGALPSPPELYLVSKQIRFEAAALAIRSVFTRSEFLELVEEAGKARALVKRKLQPDKTHESLGDNTFSAEEYRDQFFLMAILEIRKKYAKASIRKALSEVSAAPETGSADKAR